MIIPVHSLERIQYDNYHKTINIIYVGYVYFYIMLRVVDTYHLFNIYIIYIKYDTLFKNHTSYTRCVQYMCKAAYQIEDILRNLAFIHIRLI